MFSIGGGEGNPHFRPFRLFAAARIDGKRGCFLCFSILFISCYDRREKRVRFYDKSKIWRFLKRVQFINKFWISSLLFKKKLVEYIFLKKEKKNKDRSQTKFCKYFHVHYTFYYILILQNFPLRSWICIFTRDIWYDTWTWKFNAENGNFARNVEQLDGLWFEFLHFYKCYILNVTYFFNKDKIKIYSTQ